ncbi:HalOD1 output domain-containing protein [Natrinema sp. SYSU A 869]|uniref:HalOD1 output domain-containing protein n=1 Tax=Natrinema sp. SYSU A 869 TaxID=2871694 RepID=UPI001CA3C56E|nr:HalOD1 output domain-containing protein [Natrinema sp. SYSU A 869]
MGKMSTQVDNDDSQAELTLSTTAEWKKDTENTPVYAVVSAVSEASDLDMLELPPLYEAINPDALNELFTSRSEPAVGEVSFEYAGYDVVVRGTGVVEVRTSVDA